MRLVTWLPLLSVIAGLTGLTGCGGGALGQVSFSDNCRAEDATCEGHGFDGPVAVGATVRPDVRVDLKGSAAPAAHFTSVADDVLRADRGLFEGKSPGVAAVMLVTDNGTVLDFFHVWVKEPTHLRLFEVSPNGGQGEPISSRIDLLDGESMKLAASLFGDGQPLVGDATQEWTLDRPIAAILHDGRASRRRIVALEPGKATLKVRSLEQTVLVDIVVHPTTPRATTAMTKEAAR
jgi:hypothetical protein